MSQNQPRGLQGLGFEASGFKGIGLEGLGSVIRAPGLLSRAVGFRV